jgi:hypothetical protein
MFIEEGKNYRNSIVKYSPCGQCALCRNMKGFTDGKEYVVKGVVHGNKDEHFPGKLKLINDHGVQVAVKACHFSRFR